jgi:oligoribonuclease NrnB/cAMP/cGMP phosphodiesterase (DHH superfamily)
MIMVMVMRRVRLKQQCGTSVILLFARRCSSWRLMVCISYMIICLLVIVSASKEIDTKQGGGASQPCGGHKAENRLFSAPLRMKDWSHIIATEWSRKTYMWAGAHPMKSQSIDETNSSLLWNGLRERQDCPKKMGANCREASLLRKVEVAHKKARAKLERALSSSDMWHFMVGYKELEAVKMIQALTHCESTLQHFSTKCNMKFLLAFIKKASANALMQNPLIHVVEPLVPGLKIEGLTLAAKIRELESASHGQRVDDGLPPLNESIFSLKATLTANVLSISETRVLAKLWEEDLQTLLNNLFAKDKLQEMYKMMKYNSGKDQLTACKQQGDHAIDMTGHSKRRGLITNHSLGYDGSALPKCENLQPKVVNHLKEDRTRKQSSEKCAHVIKCEVEAAPFLVCSCIPSAALKAVAEFMAHHAVVQLVEINPLYKLFNKWAKYVTQVCICFLPQM